MKNNLVKNYNNYLYVFADCIPVKGATRSAIYDLTRLKIHFIPNDYFNLLSYLKSMKIKDLIEILNSENDIHQFSIFVDFLLKNELATFLKDIKKFPPLDIKWDSPSKIVNSIIDVKDNLHDFDSIFNQLDELGCQHIQLRFFSTKYNLKTIHKILFLAYNKSIVGIDILLMYDKTQKKEDYIRLSETHPIISSCIVHSSPKMEKVEVTWGYFGDLKDVIARQIIFTPQKIDSCQHCGIINKKYLSISDVRGFMENVLFNGCLNRKISIDENGCIKNCPSMEKHFGSVKNTKIKEVLNNIAFTKLWRIKKDNIKVCRSCELRYLCSDCRAYVEDDNDIFSKPSKCNYNPLKGEWVM